MEPTPSHKSLKSAKSATSLKSVKSSKSLGSVKSMNKEEETGELKKPEETVIKEEELLDYKYPDNVTTFLIPQDDRLQICYKTYKASSETVALLSEQGRDTHAETFIEDPQLGALSDLAARALVKHFGGDPMPLVQEDHRLQRAHYDALDPELPLEQCYFVPDQSFWKKYVISKESMLATATNYNWRRHGTSLKFVDIMESSLPEYWNHEEMEALALKIKDYIFAMHIKHLQSLQGRSFDDMLHDEEFEDLYISSSSQASISHDFNQPLHESETQSVETKSVSLEGSEEESGGLGKHQSELDFEQELYESEMRRKKLDEQMLGDRTRRKALRQHLIPRPSTPPPPPPEPIDDGKKKKNKKKKTKKFDGILDVSIEESQSVIMEPETDRRNVNAYLYHMKRYNFPAYDCHHINLSILGCFPNLVTLTIEFLGPEDDEEYSSRHLNFSYTDMFNLASGLSCLENLMIFRLRNCRMDTMKLEVVVESLLELPQLDSIDFGYDGLKDDCALILRKLVRRAPKLKHLELEGNKFRTLALAKLAEALYSNKSKLVYLGLGQNSFKDEDFDKLAQAMVATKQVKELCLMGTFLSQSAITNSVANKLIRNNEVLQCLDLAGIPMEPKTAIDVYNALQTNHRITSLDCRGCGFDLELDADFEILLRRNRYIAENPYIGDASWTKEAIEEFVSRTKHPALVDAYAKLEKRKICYQNMPNAYHELLKSEQTPKEEMTPSSTSSQEGEEEEEEEEEKSEDEPFVYDPNNFTEEQFKVHAMSEGPTDRFFYLVKKNAITTACDLQYK